MTMKMEKALSLAMEAHESQRRKYSGLLYAVHPINVVRILQNHLVDVEDVLCAGYLHDVIEDTDLTHDDIARELCVNVADCCERS